MKFKCISKILTLGIIVNSLVINNSFAGTLSLDTRYETFEGDNIAITDVLEEDKVDVEIEGNTLVNLFDINNYNTYMYPNKMTLTGSKLRVNYEPSDAIGNISPIGTDKTNILKNNTTYTMIVNIEGQATGSIFGKAIPDNASGINKFVFTYDELAKVDCYRLWLGSNTETIDFSIEFLMLLEGDWTNKELPDYFEGMKSVGQDDKDGHKIELSSNGVNILDKNLFKRVENNGVVNYIIEEELEGSCFERDINYYFKRDNGEKVQCLFYYLDENRKHIQADYFYSAGTKYTIKKKFSNAKYYKLIIRPFGSQSAYNSDVDDFFNNNYDIRVSTDTWHEYKPYQEVDKKEIILNEPLRGLPNGAKDKIVKKNGKWFIERNCREIVLNGSENWALIGGNWVFDNTYGFRVPFADMVHSQQLNTIQCDKLSVYNGNALSTNSLPNDIEMIGNDLAQIGIRISKTKLANGDENEFKQWLQSNPITVVYQLKTPTYEPLKIESTLNLYTDITHIFNNSVIPASIKVTVDRVLNRAIESTELAKANSTTENLSRARMWVNLINDSILKDQLQDEINSITNINDLQLDRKSASSNLDVYVKSQNMLSLSLNTNSITFDGYSGTEDMEMLGAVNISINSSLPYSLNAYMPNEITNTDKSKVIPIDILNIREESEGIYQTFDNTADKIVLKDDCVKGNNNTHNIDLKLSSNLAHKADVYKTVIKFEAEQK